MVSFVEYVVDGGGGVVVDVAIVVVVVVAAAALGCACGHGSFQKRHCFFAAG